MRKRSTKITLSSKKAGRKHKKEKPSSLAEQYRLLFESNPHPMWVYDLETLAFLAVNDAAVHNYGYSRDEFLSMTIKDIRPPEDIPALLDNVSKVTSGLDDAGVWRHKKKDGSVILVEITSHTMTFDGKRAEVVLANNITERKKAENALKESEEKYRDLFENANDVICILDSDLNFKDANKKAEELFGYSMEEFRNMNVMEIIPSEQHPVSEIEFDRLRKKESYEKFVGKVRTKDGRFLDVEVSSSPIIENGKVVGSRDIVRDITKRKRTEESLRLAEEKYRSIFENAVEGIFQTRLDGRVQSINPAFAHMLGYGSPQEFIKQVKNVKKVYSQPGRRDEFIRLMRANGIVKDFEFNAFRRDGGEICLSMNARALLDEDGNLAGFEGTAVDITERKIIEKALSQSEKKYRNLIEKIQDGVFIFQDGKVRFSNEAFAKMGGYTIEEVIGKDLRDMVAPEDLEMVKDRYFKRVAGEDVPAEYEFNALHRDGKTRITVIVKVGIIDYHGRIAIMGTVKDITERRLSEEKLRLFRNLVDRSNDAIFVNDPETGCILDANDRACINLGYTKEELLNMRVYDFETVLPDHFSWKEHVKEIQKKGYVLLEGFHRRKDGMTFPVEVNVNNIFLGKSNYMVAVVRDITERRLAEKELRDSEKRYRELFETSRDGIAIIDLDGRYMDCNPAFLDMLGISKIEELRSMSYKDVTSVKYHENEFRVIKEQTLVEGYCYEHEAEYIRKTGERIPVRFQVYPIRGADNQPVGMWITVRDITERKRAEMMLKERARAELYGFIVSALPVFASNVPSVVRNNLVKTFADRFEKNIKPRFEEEMNLLGYPQAVGRGDLGTKEAFDVYMLWLSGLFTNFGIRNRTRSSGIKREIEFMNCPWKGEAKGNPVFCFICRTIVLRSLTWTSLKGSADQSSSIANGSETCRFELYARPVEKVY